MRTSELWMMHPNKKLQNSPFLHKSSRSTDVLQMCFPPVVWCAHLCLAIISSVAIGYRHDRMNQKITTSCSWSNLQGCVLFFVHNLWEYNYPTRHENTSNNDYNKVVQIQGCSLCTITIKQTERGRILEDYSLIQKQVQSSIIICLDKYERTDPDLSSNVCYPTSN